MGLEPTVSSRPQGINAFWEALITNPSRQLANFAGDAGSWLTGRGPAAQGKGAGDRIFGPAAGVGPSPANRSSWRQGGGGTFSAPPAEPDPEPRQSLSDQILAQLLGGGGGQGTVGAGGTNPFLVDYSPARDAVNRNASTSADAIRSVYAQLQNELGAAGDSIDDRYATSQQNIEGIRDDTAQRMQDSYAASQAQQADVLNALGLQSTIQQTIDDGRNLAGRGALAAERVNERAQADLTYNNSVGTAEGTYNDRLKQAGSSQGAYQQSQLQGNLLDRLGEIDMAEQQANAQAGQQWMAAQAQGGGGLSPSNQIDIWQTLLQMENEREQAGFDREQDAYSAAQNSPQAKQQQLVQILQFLGMDQGNVPEDLRETIFKSLLG